jgi:hypothetical protein
VLYLCTGSLRYINQEFDLSGVWVESTSDSFREGLAFRIITPEKRFVLCTQNKEEKNNFLLKIREQLELVLLRNNSANQKFRAVDFKKRFLRYKFEDAEYEGEWDNGAFHG